MRLRAQSGIGNSPLCILDNARILAIHQRVTSTVPPADPGFDQIACGSLESSLGQSRILRMAKISADYARQRGLVVHDGELIVGARAMTHVPGSGDLNALEDFRRAAPPPRTPSERARLYAEHGLLRISGNHICMDFETVQRIGLGGLARHIDRRIDELDRSAKGAEGERDFLESMKLLLEGHQELCRRYGGHADGLSESCRDPVRAGELRRIAANCLHVSDNPPRDFWEACQLAWFCFFLVPDSPGRIDQYLYPSYRRDIDNGSLSRAEATELLACLWMKYHEYLGAGETRSGNHHLVLGGQLADGASAVNDLSFLCLEVAEELRLTRPQVGVRWNRRLGREFLERAVRALRAGNGSPDFCNDEQIVPALVHAGIPVEDARDFCLSGCHEVAIAGRSHMGACEGMFNMPKLLRMALGLEPRLRTPVALSKIDSFDALWDLLEREMLAMAEVMHEWSEALDESRAADHAWLEASLVTRGCIERGRTLAQGGALYNGCNWDAIGIADLADSLYVMRKLVFEEHRITLPELVDGARGDWAGKEALRLQVKRDVSFFGNDNDEVDAIAGKIVETMARALRTRPLYRGGMYNLGTLGGYENAHIEFGMKTGATVDGRRAGVSFASSLGPAAGRDRQGPTAMLNSVARLPHVWLPTSVTVNLTIDPSLLEHNEGIGQLASLIEAHFLSGGQQLQLTLVDQKTLQAARARPADYAHLMVRVAGYAAPFVSLDDATQKEIMARTAHTLL